MKLVDLTHIFTDAMPTYPGDPMSRIQQAAWLKKDGYADHLLSTGLHVGTHLDAPAHMIEGGKKIHELPLEMFSGKGVVVDVRRRKKIDMADMSFQQKLGSRIVLFYTGWSGKYEAKEYFTDFPVMTEALARELVKRKVKMVGLDTASPDLPAPRARQAGRAPFAVHKILLGAGILIIENLTNLEALLPHKHIEVYAFPLKLVADAAPARVVALVKQETCG